MLQPVFPSPSRAAQRPSVLIVGSYRGKLFVADELLIYAETRDAEEAVSACSSSMAFGWRPKTKDRRANRLVTRSDEPCVLQRSRGMTVATISAEACAHGVVMLASERRADGAAAWWACRDCGVPFAPIGAARGAPSAGLERPSRDGTSDQEYVSIRELSRRSPTPRVRSAT